jgi:hypothetical protein
MENNKNFKANGILWSSCKKYYKDILLELSSKFKIEQITIYNLANQYANFIVECYKHDEDVMSDGYIEEKIHRLLQDDTAMVVSFTLDIENPQYKYNAKGTLQSIQARKLKEGVREKFSQIMENYFLDNIIHIADNPEESLILENVFDRYKKYAIKSCSLDESNASYILELCTKKESSCLSNR